MLRQVIVDRPVVLPNGEQVEVVVTASEHLVKRCPLTLSKTSAPLLAFTLGPASACGVLATVAIGNPGAFPRVASRYTAPSGSLRMCEPVVV